MKNWAPIIFVILLSLGCGRRTPPVPRLDLNQHLMPLKVAAPYYKDQWLVFTWALAQEDPKERAHLASEIDHFRLYIGEPNCPSCGAQGAGWVKISGDGLSLTPGELDQQKTQALAEARVYRFKDSYTLELPPDFVEAAPEFTLEYRTIDGSKNPASVPLVVQRPGNLPVPKLLNHRFTPAQCDFPCPDRRRLAIKWEPLLEREVTRIDPQGGVYSDRLYYGLTLYSLIEGVEHPLNEGSIYTGALDIEVGPEPIWIHYSDRFGNLSAPLVLEGLSP